MEVMDEPLRALVMSFNLAGKAQTLVEMGLKEAADLDYLDDVVQNPKCTLDLVTEAKLNRLKAAWLEQRQREQHSQGAAAALAPPAALQPSRGGVGGRSPSHSRLPARAAALWGSAGGVAGGKRAADAAPDTALEAAGEAAFGGFGDPQAGGRAGLGMVAGGGFVAPAERERKKRSVLYGGEVTGLN